MGGTDGTQTEAYGDIGGTQIEAAQTDFLYFSSFLASPH